MKTLRCRDAGFDCNEEINAATEEEVLQQAAAHAKEVHHVDVTPEMARQIRGLIHDQS